MLERAHQAGVHEWAPAPPGGPVNEAAWAGSKPDEQALRSEAWDRWTHHHMHMTAQFEEELASFMRLRGIRSKSEAIRVAILEGLERSQPRPSGGSFQSWLGLAGPEPDSPERPLTEDELWSSTRR